MPVYTFQFRDSGGRKRTGEREAVSASLLARDLADAGLVPLEILDAGETSKPAGMFRPIRIFGRKITPDELIIFSHQMYTLTKAGISVARALRGLADSAKNPALGEVLGVVADNLEGGEDLATCLQRHDRAFSDLYISVIHVGENTGRLDEAFRRIAGYLEFEREARRRIASATRYPMFVLIAIVTAIGILNIFVIPAFAQVFEKFHADLPWQTQAILAVSNFTVAYWPYMLGVSAHVPLKGGTRVSYCRMTRAGLVAACRGRGDTAF